MRLVRVEFVGSSIRRLAGFPAAGLSHQEQDHRAGESVSWACRGGLPPRPHPRRRRPSRAKLPRSTTTTGYPLPSPLESSGRHGRHTTPCYIRSRHRANLPALAILAARADGLPPAQRSPMRQSAFNGRCDPRGTLTHTRSRPPRTLFANAHFGAPRAARLPFHPC